jgi:hypothetical protein
MGQVRGGQHGVSILAGQRPLEGRQEYHPSAAQLARAGELAFLRDPVGVVSGEPEALAGVGPQIDRVSSAGGWGVLFLELRHLPLLARGISDMMIPYFNVFDNVKI